MKKEAGNYFTIAIKSSENSSGFVVGSSYKRLRNCQIIWLVWPETDVKILKAVKCKFIFG